MANRFVKNLLIPILTLALAGCAARPSVPAETENPIPVQPTVAEDTVSQETTAAETTAPVDTIEENLIDPTVETDAAEVEHRELPYLLQIDRYDHPVYQGPGYDYGTGDTVRKPGIYTIVEESIDYEGNLWGKLKSGIGWVDLTLIQSESYKNALISANYADENLVLHGACHHYSSGQEYAIPVAFRAYGKLREVTLFAYEFNADGLCPGTELFTLQEMTEELPLVADLAFPGDMTTYGIRFVDEAGESHVYSIFISGRNGALMLNEESAA